MLCVDIDILKQLLRYCKRKRLKVYKAIRIGEMIFISFAVEDERLKEWLISKSLSLSRDSDLQM